MSEIKQRLIAAAVALEARDGNASAAQSRMLRDAVDAIAELERERDLASGNAERSQRMAEDFIDRAEKAEAALRVFAGDVEGATEYVLALINADLTAERDNLRARLEAIGRISDGVDGDPDAIAVARRIDNVLDPDWKQGEEG